MVSGNEVETFQYKFLHIKKAFRMTGNVIWKYVVQEVYTCIVPPCVWNLDRLKTKIKRKNTTSNENVPKCSKPRGYSLYWDDRDDCRIF